MVFSQSTGGPFVGHLSRRPVSAEVPSAWGPRNRGQSSPGCSAALNRNATKQNAMRKNLRRAVTANLFRFAQIHADKFVLVPGIEKSVGQRGIGADLEGENLGAGIRLESILRRGGADQLAPFREDQQLIAGQGERGRADGIISPLNFAGLQLNTT